MYQLNGIPANGQEQARPGDLQGDVRVRVDFKALARFLGPKAIKSRSLLAELCGGAVVVEAFNVRSCPEKPDHD